MALRMGFIVNPIAGMGGSVGLKGTDGPRYAAAIARGADPVAPDRALRFLSRLRVEGLTIVTVDGPMGGDSLRQSGICRQARGGGETDNEGEAGSERETTIECEFVASPDDSVAVGGTEAVQRERQSPEEAAAGSGPRPSEPWPQVAATSPADTLRATERLLAAGVELIAFVGGDGTARDVHSCAGHELPLVGVPAGVKMFSAVFSPTPEQAARAVLGYAESRSTMETEILDVDEDAYGTGRLETRLYGIALVPSSPHLVSVGKQVVRSDDEEELVKAAIADYVAELIGDRTAVLGPGSTVAAVADRLGVETTLLGFDVVRDGVVVARDAAATQIVEHVDAETIVVLSPIGAQGYFLGRGTQPLTPAILRRLGPAGLVVVSTPSKLAVTPVLRVDTGDPGLDEALRGYREVVTGYRESRMVRVV